VEDSLINLSAQFAASVSHILSERQPGGNSSPQASYANAYIAHMNLPKVLDNVLRF